MNESENTNVKLTSELVGDGRKMLEKLSEVLLESRTVSSIGMYGNAMTISFRDGTMAEVIAFKAKFNEHDNVDWYYKKLFPQDISDKSKNRRFIRNF